MVCGAIEAGAGFCKLYLVDQVSVNVLGLLLEALERSPGHRREVRRPVRMMSNESGILCPGAAAMARLRNGVFAVMVKQEMRRSEDRMTRVHGLTRRMTREGSE
jgi:hypothetical protein